MGSKQLGLKEFFYRVYKEFTAVISKKDIGVIALSSLGINIFSLAFPFMILRVYDHIFIQSNISILTFLTLGVFVAIVLEGVLRLCRTYIIGWNSAVYEHQMMCAVLKHNLNDEFVPIERKTFGENLQHINEVKALRSFYGGQALMICIDLPFVFIFIVLIAVLAKMLVLVPLLFLACFLSYAFCFGDDFKKNIQHQHDLEVKRMDFMMDGLKGMHTIKGNGVEKYFLRKYEYIQSHLNEVNYTTFNVASTARNIGWLFSCLMFLMMMVFGAIYVIEGTITTGILMACIYLSAQIIHPVQKALSIWSEYQKFQISHQKIMPPSEISRSDRLSYHVLSEKKGRVEIKNLSFRYSREEPWVFKNMNLTIPSGKMIAVSGLSGCGKTTLLKLIAGLYEPTEGSVLVDGMPPTKIPPDKLLEYVGFLSSNSSIFQGTIIENITMFQDRYNDAAYEISSLLGIDIDVNKLSKGFMTPVIGGFADPIPPSLKQRISIARALILKPKLILFDSADRSLDKKGYNFVFQLLGKIRHKATIIVVSEDRNLTHLAQSEFEIKKADLQLKGPKEKLGAHIFPDKGGGE